MLRAAPPRRKNARLARFQIGFLGGNNDAKRELTYYFNHS